MLGPMHKDGPILLSRTQEGGCDPARLGEPGGQASLILPVPVEEDVAGFVALYRETYGVELDTTEAHQILGGLMRFLYLTRREGPKQTAPPLDGRRPAA